jgi:tetratricopeptide (TPR) repeat protein
MKSTRVFLLLLLVTFVFPFSLRCQTMELKELYPVNYKKDISSLLDSLKEDLYPKSSTTGAVHFYRGISYLQQKYYREAIQDFKSARIDSTVSKTMCNFYIGLAYLELDLPDSIWDVCSYALTVPVAKLKKPDFWENSPFSKDMVFFSFLLGTNEVMHNSPDTNLIDGLFKFATKESKFFEAFVNYGNYCFTIGRYKKAVDLFLKARELDKTEDTVLLLGMGFFYRLSGDLIQSQKAYDLLLSGHSDFALGYNNRGCLYGYLEKFDLALRNINKAIKLNPRFMEAYCNRGLVYLKTQKWDKSIADFSIALQFQPDNADAYYYRGFAKKTKGDLQGSVVDFTRALELKKYSQQ